MDASGVVLRPLFGAIGAVAAAQPCPEASRSFTGRLAMRYISFKYVLMIAKSIPQLHLLKDKLHGNYGRLWIFSR